MHPRKEALNPERQSLNPTHRHETSILGTKSQINQTSNNKTSNKILKSFVYGLGSVGVDSEHCVREFPSIKGYPLKHNKHSSIISERYCLI